MRASTNGLCCTEVDTKSPAPAKAQPYTLAGAGLLVSRLIADLWNGGTSRAELRRSVFCRSTSAGASEV